MVVLDKTMYVTHVILIGGECLAFCGARDLERIIAIEMFDEDPNFQNAAAQMCTDQKSIILDGKVTEVRCDSYVTGRYLRIKSMISQKLTLCEVEVYGGPAIEKEWTTFSCPDPPLVDDASVTLSYTKTMSIATYTCNGTEIMCPGDASIYCFGEDGWTSKPGKCHKTVWEAPSREKLLEIPLCPLALGTVIELWATPAENKGSLLFHDKYDDILRLEHILNSDIPLALYHMTGGIVDDVDLPSIVPFVLHQEAHIVISILTDYLLFEVDDEVLYKYPVRNLNIHKTISLIPSDGFVIRRARIYPNMMPDMYKERVNANLAFKAAVSASSTHGNAPSFGVNGYPQPTILGSCWNAGVDDKDQWYQVDLGKQFFIRDVKIDITNECARCGENLVAGKETAASDTWNGSVSEGVRTVDSCYSIAMPSAAPQGSVGSGGEQWWQVDLGAEETVSTVVIGASDLSDLSVMLYDTNPMNTNTTGKLCADKFEQFRTFVRLHCSQPTRGRYLRIERTQATPIQIDMTLCGVWVYNAIRSSLHDVSVLVYTGDPQTDKDVNGKLCASFQDEFPDSTRTLSCKDDVWGRYIRITADDIKHKYDQMTLCEVEVYGDKAVKRRWSPLDCPLPPILGNMRASVEYGRREAIATMHCLDGFSMCNGPMTVTCTEKDSWIGQPGKCLPTTFTSGNDSITSSTFCPLRLGDAVEIFFTSKQEISRFNLGEITDKGKMRALVQVDLDQGFEEAVVKSPLEGKKYFYDGLQIKLQVEQKIVITFLSDYLEFDFDGVKYFTQIESPHRINHYQMSEVVAGSTRQINILRAGAIPTIYVPYPDNIAVSGIATSSSDLTIQHDPSSVLMENSIMPCWSSGVNDMNPWWQVDLVHYYYVSKVEITNEDLPLGNFVIELFHSTPESGEQGQLCLRNERVFPPGTTNMMLCTEKVAGRLLRITAANRTGELNDVLEFCKLAIYGGRIVTRGSTEDTRNIALYRPAAASTAYTTASLTLPAGLALDGNRNFMLFGESCWMAEKGDLNPWWQVDLQHLYFISHIIITSRKCPAQCNFFLHDFIIEVFPDDPQISLQSELCFQYGGAIIGGNTETVKCLKRVLGRYVKIRGLPRNDQDDVLTMCEVSIHGAIATIEETSSANLAKSRPVTSSSRYYSPGRAVDGNKKVTLLDASCWLSDTGDRDPWLTVELDALYSISEVKITNIEAAICGLQCKDKLHDFIVEAFLNDPQDGGDGVLCFNYTGIFPPAVTKAMPCDTDKVLGRYIRLSSFGRTVDSDVLTVCEIEVFGAKVKDEWTPFSCPEPPKVDNACLDICYSADRAVATYTCNTNYSMCTGSDILYCTGEAGWIGTPGTCMQTTIQLNFGHVGSLKEFPICYPKLGEGIELWIIPEQNGASLTLFNDEEGSEALTLEIPDSSVTPVTLKSRHQGNIVQIEKPQNLFPAKKMSCLKIIFLSEKLLIMVDDQTLIGYRHTTNVPRAYFVTSNDFLRIKMVRPVTRYAKQIERSDMVDNIAEIKRATSDSHHQKNHPRLVTDGDLSQLGDALKCWYPIKGAEKQWIKINLDYYYFIREVVIYSGNDGGSIKEPHDFAIDVLPTEVIDDLTMRCAFYEGAMPRGTIERLKCKDDVWGMFVQISNTYVTGEWDVLNFCEIQIYGDTVIQKKSPKR